MCSIYVDADSCETIEQIENIAREYGVPVILYCNTHHFIDSDYSEIHYVEKRKHSADFAIIRHCKEDDIVITRDYGLAAMVLAKHVRCLTPNGAQYTNRIMDQLLFRSYVSQKYQKRSGLRIPGFRSIGIEKALIKNLTANNRKEIVA